MKSIKASITAVIATVASFGGLPPLPGRAATSPETNLKTHPPAWTQTQSLILAQEWRACQQLGSEYREVIAFETPNYYINICLRGNQYFYAAEQKNNPSDRLVLTAQRLSRAKYQVSSADTVYAVTNYLQVPNASRGGFELVVTQNGRVVQQENSIRGFDSSNVSPGSQAAPPAPGDTVLNFRTTNYAVRLYRQGGQMLMNVFDKRNKITLLQGTPVQAEQNPEGYIYTNSYGKVQVKVFQPQSNTSYSIQVGDNSPEPAL